MNGKHDEIGSVVGDARKRMEDLRERMTKRLEKYPEVNTGPSLVTDELRALQWRSEAWRNASADLPNHDEQHARLHEWPDYDDS